MKETGKLQDLVLSFLSSTFVFVILYCLDKFCNFKTEPGIAIISRIKAHKPKINNFFFIAFNSVLQPPLSRNSVFSHSKKVLFPTQDHIMHSSMHKELS